NGKMLAREPLPLPGHPPLYLTERGVFEGPKCPPDLLSTAAPNPIPARVVESSSGLHLFRALGLPIPEKIQSRVRVKPLEVTIACNLEPIYPGSATELCCFDVTASEPGGRNKMTWTGTGWESQSRRTSNFKWLIDEKPDDEIVTPDRTNMDRIPPLLAPLALAPDPRVSRLSMKVRKDFPTIFADWLKRVPPEITVLLEGDLKCFAGGNVVGTVNLDVAESSQDWFDLKVAIEVTDLALTKEEIKLLLNAKGGFVRLKNKGWKRLEFDISPEEDQQLAALGLSPREFSAEPQRLHVLQLADAAARRFLDEDQVEKIQRRAGEIKARVTPPIPGAIRAELRPYQTEGFHFLAYLASNRFGGILADDMGLGKTLQTLSWLTWLRSEAASTGKEAKPSLVVAPKSVMENWQKETSKFSPGIRVRTWRASELVDLGTNLDQADLHIINYNQLRLAGEGIGGISWQAVILDEGQYIKNPNSQTAQIARVLKSDHRLVLTGTPIENRLMDLWSLMAFAMPGMLGPRQQFSRHYDAPGDPLARKRLAARVRPFLLRRTKSQVAKDLPDRVEEELYCELEGEQKTLYRAELKRAQSVLLGIKSQKELAKQTFHVLTSILRLRQICCSPRLLDPGSKAPNAKMEALMDQLEPLMQEGHKVLVFSQFVEILRMVQDEVQSRQWTFFFLAGDTENRGELVDHFQDHKGSAVFLISLKAGGFGLNLTAASYVVLYDPWWNPAVENQAIDRTHRIGQRNTVNAYRLIVKGSIEEKIRELQKAKK
ncbi:MAG: DEAD/DEAH box helicase, partial [Verrucomicrobia bacterium]|nr:DEAD/DEAH box helicase [Verrucomicrobiota bacterium]